MDPTGLVVLGAVIVIAIAVGWYRHRRSAAGFRQLAGEHGWTYAEWDSGVEARLGRPFGRRQGAPKHVLSGTHRGRELLTCQLSSYSVVAVSLPAGRRGVLEISWSEAGEPRPFAGEHDLAELPAEDAGLDEFDVAFFVYATRAGLARQLLHPPLVEFLTVDDRAATFHWPIWLRRDHLFTWSKERLGVEGVLARLDYLCDVLDRVPSSVWKT